MSNRTSLRMRVLPRFPARIVGTDGIKVEQESNGAADLIVRSAFDELADITAVPDPATNYFMMWDKDNNYYRRIPFQGMFDSAGVSAGFPTIDAAEAANIPVVVHAIEVYGSATVGDGLGGLYIDTNNGASETFISGDGRTWYLAQDIRKERLTDSLQTSIENGDAALVLAQDIEVSARYAEATKLYYAAEMGLSPNVDMGAGFDEFLAYAYTNGGKAIFAPGEYVVSQKGLIRTLAKIEGQGNPGVDGTKTKGGTVFKAAAALRTSGGAVLETENFAANTGTQTKLITDATMTWGFELRDFAIDRGWSQNFTDATTDAAKGRGLNIYGRRYKARDIGIYNCEGVGFYTECGNPTSPPAGWYFDYRNNQDGVIEDIDIQFTAYEGFISFGPGDTFLNRITTGLAGDARATVYPQGTPLNSLIFPGDRISNFVLSANDTSGASGTHEIGVIHAHTNWNGWAFRALGGAVRLVRLKAENLIAEGALGSVFIQTGVYAQIGKINTRNNSVVALSAPTQFADVRLSGNFEIDIGSIEGRKRSPTTTDAGLTGVRVDQDNVQIGVVKHQGNGQAGHAVTVEASRKNVFIGSVLAPNSRGTAQDGQPSAGLYTKTGADGVVIGNLMSSMSDYGWRNASTGKVAVLSGHAEVSSSFASNVAGVQLDATPANSHLRKSKLTATSLAGAILQPDANVLITATAAGLTNPAIVQTGVTLTIPHGMWRTPNYQREVDISVQFNGTRPVVAPSIEPTAADATNVTANYNQSVVATSASGGGTVVNLKI